MSIQESSELVRQHVQWKAVRRRLETVRKPSPILPPEPEPEPEPVMEAAPKKTAQEIEDEFFAPRYPSIAKIVDVVCTRYGVSRLDIVSERRTKHIARARQIAIYLSRELTPHSYPAIARRFGGRDHTTALASVWRVEQLMEREDGFAEGVNAARAEVLASI
jgi:hypothetical protein